MEPQKHSIGGLWGARKFSDRNWFPLGFWLGDRRRRWCWPAPLFPAMKLNSVFQGSAPLPPGVLSPCCSRAELLTFNIPDVKARWLSELMESDHSAFASQTQGLCLAGRAASPPPWLPPASPRSAHCLFTLSTLFLWPLVYAWLQRVHSASLLGYLGRCGWNLSDQQDEVSPAPSYASIFLLQIIPFCVNSSRNIYVPETLLNTRVTKIYKT